MCNIRNPNPRPKKWTRPIPNRGFRAIYIFLFGNESYMLYVTSYVQVHILYIFKNNQKQILDMQRYYVNGVSTYNLVYVHNT